MNYFDPYPCLPDQTTISAWDSQVAAIVRTPRLAELFNKGGSEILPRFAACYVELRALPRSARRALQRQLRGSRELAAILPEWLQGQPARALQRKLAYSLAGAALLLALGQGVAAATTITVTTNKPGIDSDGKCSLIEAIINANDDAATHPDCAAGSGADTIILPRRRTHTLTAVNNSTYGASGLPVITSPITIQGNGAKIVRKKSAPPFRLIAVNSSGDLTLLKVVLSGGTADYGGGVANFGTLTIENSTISGNTASEHGGGVLSTGRFFCDPYGYSCQFFYPALTITNSSISGNTALSGGGVYNSRSTLSIQNSTISKNAATGSPNSHLVYADDGGGVINRYGTALIENSTISGNKADRRGGGVVNSGAYSYGVSSLTITNSTISGNTSELGGGVDNSRGGTLSIENSTISRNTARVFGGGVNHQDGTISIENSTISGNTAVHGGGVFIIDYSSTFNITNSTISGNKASFNGGGIFNSDGYLSLVDSTITRNRAGDSGGGLLNEGTLNMTNSTISNNQAPTGPDISP